MLSKAAGLMGWHEGCNVCRAEGPSPGVLRRAVVWKIPPAVFLPAATTAKLRTSAERHPEASEDPQWKDSWPTKDF